jgi:hypothetical protein
MPIAARSIRVTIPLGSGNDTTGSNSQIRPAKAVFKSKVKSAEAALGDFRLRYASNDDDRNLHLHQVSIRDVAVVDNVVSFDVHACIEDASGDTHPFEGDVVVVVMAEVT